MTFKTQLLAKSTVLACAGALMLAATAAAPAMAQEAAAAVAAPTTDAEMQAAGEAFETRMNAMGSEIEAAVTANATDAAAQAAAVDQVLVRYEPEINAFADTLDRFLATRITASTNEQEVAGLTQARTAAVPAIRGIPAQVRASVAGAAAASAQAPAAAEGGHGDHAH